MTEADTRPASDPGDHGAGLDARTALVDSTRRVMSAVATADVNARDVARATALLDEATALLSPGRHSRVRRIPLDSRWSARARASEPVTMAWLNPLRFPLTVVVDGRRATAMMTPTAIHEGPPGCLHGGWSAAILDHLLGVLVCAHDLPARTARLDLSYRRPTRLDVPTEFGGEILEISGRKALTRAWVSQDGVTTVSADGIFVLPADHSPSAR